MTNKWYQLTTVEIFASTTALALFAYVNTIRFSVGSGFWIFQQGIPFPFVTVNPTLETVEFDFFNLGLDFAVGILIGISVVCLFRWMKRFRARTN